MAQGKAKVAWKDVCLPKLEGSLGIKPLFLWNKAIMAFHLWSVVTNRQSLWVKWIHTYQGCLGCFLELEENSRS